MRHYMIDGKCDKCGCRAWEQSKPCSKPTMRSKSTRKPRQLREPRERNYAPGSGEYNDFMFGTGGN